MKLLLDTHVLIWALSDYLRLPEKIIDLISESSNEVYVSVASLWEIAIKHKKKPNEMFFTAEEIRNYCQRAGYLFLSLSIDNVTTFEKIDFSMSSDPFDQILISQSVSNNMKLITHDYKIKSVGVGNIEYF